MKLNVVWKSTVSYTVKAVIDHTKKGGFKWAVEPFDLVSLT